MSALIRRALVGVLILLAAMLVGFTSAAPDGTTVAPKRADFDLMPFPSHIEWYNYTVKDEGYILISPEADSLGHHEAIKLPIGSEVYVPHRVLGEDPSARQRRKWHES
jgi:hypothetical protein